MTPPPAPRIGTRRPAAAIAVAAVMVLAGACGDDDGDDAGDDTAATTVAVTDAEGTQGVADVTTATIGGEPSGTTGTAGTTATDATTATTLGELTADAAGYTTAVAAYLRSTNGVALTADQADCAAPGWVDVITLERLEASGQSPNDIAEGTLQTLELGLDEDDAQGLLDSLTGCDVSLRELFLASVGDQPTAECIDGELSDESVEQLLREALVNTEPSAELADEIDRVSEACGIED